MLLKVFGNIKKTSSTFNNNLITYIECCQRFLIKIVLSVRQKKYY